jgi:hypothetical protein
MAWLIIAGVLLSVLGGCATAPPAIRLLPVGEACCAAFPSGTAIAHTAGSLVGAATIEWNGQRIGYDCAGVARAIYLAHGIDLYDGRQADSEASGVRTIYAHVSAQGRIHRGPTAFPGDLVFFDNTWDANGDGLPNDPLTHVGIVEGVEPDGTVLFISRVSRSIERYRLNLTQPAVHQTPEGRTLNDYLRRKHPRDSRDARRLTSELFAAFGTRVDPDNKESSVQTSSR